MIRVNLQFFGGRGSSSGIMVKNNVIAFRRTEEKKSESDTEREWDYRGYVESVNHIAQAAKEADTRRKVERVYKAIRQQEEAITAAIDSNIRGEESGDSRILLTQRRRLRQLKKELINKGILG